MEISSPTDGVGIGNFDTSSTDRNLGYGVSSYAQDTFTSFRGLEPSSSRASPASERQPFNWDPLAPYIKPVAGMVHDTLANSWVEIHVMDPYFNKPVKAGLAFVLDYVPGISTETARSIANVAVEPIESYSGYLAKPETNTTLELGMWVIPIGRVAGPVAKVGSKVVPTVIARRLAQSGKKGAVNTVEYASWKFLGVMGTIEKRLPSTYASKLATKRFPIGSAVTLAERELIAGAIDTVVPGLGRVLVAQTLSAGRSSMAGVGTRTGLGTRLGLSLLAAEERARKTPKPSKLLIPVPVVEPEEVEDEASTTAGVEDVDNPGSTQEPRALKPAIKEEHYGKKKKHQIIW